MLIENIILLEKNPELRDRLVLSLSARGCAVRTVPALEAAQDAAGNGDADLLILNLEFFAGPGHGFFEGFRPGAFKPLVLLVAAPDFLPAGMERVRAEAFDLLIEPFSEAQFELAVRRAENHARLLAANRLLSRDQGPGLKADLIGISPAMDQLRQAIRQVAVTHAAILVQGERGTGQEVVAKALYLQSARAGGPFLEVNCLNRPERSLEIELFGQKIEGQPRRVGAVEAAHGGTIVLEEIGELSPSLQARLLRLLQEQTFERLGSARGLEADVRVIATTSRDLEAKVRRQEFREDLYWSLHIVPIVLPPLRERPEDIPLLAEHFRQRLDREHGTEVLALSPAALAILQTQLWPGNGRELESVMERALLLCGKGVLQPEHLGYGLAADPALAASEEDPAGPIRDAAGETLAEVEKQHIFEILQRCDDNRTHAAERLGISIRTLRNKLKEYRSSGAAAVQSGEESCADPEICRR